jgi:hypothetical protein
VSEKNTEFTIEINYLYMDANNNIFLEISINNNPNVVLYKSECNLFGCQLDQTFIVSLLEINILVIKSIKYIEYSDINEGKSTSLLKIQTNSTHPNHNLEGKFF